MADIIIYTKATCPFCTKAKALLTHKGAKFTEIDISSNDTLRSQMMEKANGRHTVPQVFINDTHIGGCDDLLAADRSGDLDKKLAA
ncbi:MAG: glutaredoxin 3 [Alphaproteobacteria bacterium]|jgi:glutaredoxin 3